MSAQRTDTSEMTAPATGRILIEECSGHKHVEWDVQNPLLLQNEDILESPTFQYGNLGYILRLNGSSKVLRLYLVRTAELPNSPVRFITGVKRKNGSYHHEMGSGVLVQDSENETWKGVKHVCSFSRIGLESFLSPDGLVTFFLHLNTEDLLEVNDTCDYGLGMMSPLGEGRILEDDCGDHKHVEWSLEYMSVRACENVSSPIFKIGNQRYLVDLTCISEAFRFQLFRMGPSSEYTVRYFAGMKRADGFYHHVIDSGELEQKEKCVLWTNVETFSRFGISLTENRFLDRDGHITFFIRMSLEGAQTGSEVCIHDLGMMNPFSEGRIHEDECSDHKHVEWSVDYVSLPVSETVSSPVFEIGTQRYLMDLTLSPETFRVRLFRMGPSVECAMRYFAGMKRADGFYHYVSDRSEVDQKETCVFWTIVTRFIDFGIKLTDSRFLDRDGQVTFFLRMSMERPETGSDVCVRDLFQMSSPGEGCIRQKECSGHNHVEWDVDYTSLFQGDCTVNSPAFEIGAQRYLLECRLNTGNYGVHLTILRTGPSSHRPRRIFVGVKLSDGSYDPNIKDKVINVKEKCEFWTRAVWFFISTRTEIEDHHLGPDKLFTLFLRMDTEQSDGEADTCVQDIGNMSPRCVGNVSEKYWASYKKVEWSLEFECSSGFVTSPFFTVAEQNYLCELGCDEKGSHPLRLYRMGPSVKKSV